jgi:hypothetical protein
MKSQNWEGGMSAVTSVPQSDTTLSMRRTNPRRAMGLASLKKVLLWLATVGALFVISPTEHGRPELAIASAKSKPKKAKSSPAAAQMAKLLEAQGQGVMQCAVKQALDKGASKVEVDAKVTVNNRGQVIDVNVAAKVEKGDPKPVRECVDALIRALKFPASDAPLTTVQREWAIQ